MEAGLAAALEADWVEGCVAGSAMAAAVDEVTDSELVLADAEVAMAQAKGEGWAAG